MFGLSFSLANLLPVLVVAVLVLGGFGVYRYLTRTTPISSVHSGSKKKEKGGHCKFDVKEIRKRSLKRPDIDVSNLPAQDPRIVALLKTITTGNVEQALKELSGEVDVTVAGAKVKIVSRSSYNKLLDTSMTYLEEFYAKLGIKTQRVKYTWRGKTLYNLEATIPGASQKVLIVGSHLDSTAGSTWSNEAKAPGADDNASGTVALMELAKAITALQKSGAKIGVTIRLLHFTGEEQGLWGSYTYSDKVANENTELVGMLQMDMIGYRTAAGNRVDLHDDVDRNGSHRLVVLLARGAAQYKLQLEPYDTHDKAVHDRSDQAGFLDHGYQALAISEEFTEEEGAFNPNYHSTKDRVGAMNLPYMVEIVRMLLIGVVELAEIK
jgi:hypothetical protein